jgi:predicted Rossmann-fold nucleotide-binding protein
MKIGIIGRTKADDKDIINKAKEIGTLIASLGHVVVTGGTEGYPHIVALAAIKAGGKAVSYATGLSISDHSQFHSTDLSKYSKIIFQKKYCDKKLAPTDNYLRSLNM